DASEGQAPPRLRKSGSSPGADVGLAAGNRLPAPRKKRLRVRIDRYLGTAGGAPSPSDRAAGGSAAHLVPSARTSAGVDSAGHSPRGSARAEDEPPSQRRRDRRLVRRRWANLSARGQVEKGSHAGQRALQLQGKT